MPDSKDTSKWQRTKKILWESTLNAPVRGAYNLMNTPYEDLMGSDKEKVRKAAESSFDAASGVTIGSGAAPKPRGALTMGAGRSRKPKAETKPKAEAGSKPGQKKLMDKLEASRQKGAKARNTFRKDNGTMSSRVEGTKTRPRTAKESEKFGPLAKRPDNLPAKQGSRAVTKQNSDSRVLAVVREDRAAVVPYKKASNLPAKTGKPATFADKGGSGRLGTNLKRAAAGAAVAGAAAGLYKGADKSKATQKDGPRDDRASSLSAKSDKAATFKAKRQGMNVPGSPTNPKSRKQAGDKSRLNKGAKPEKKMTNFERMKQRGYEKEGVGGRSVTSKGAKSRVMAERKYKFKDLFKKR